MTNETSVTTQPAPTTKPKRNRRLLWFMLVLLVGASIASFVVFRFILPSVPRELVGTWQVIDGEMKGATLEFRWYGVGYAAKRGEKEVAESSVRVRGKRIFMTYKTATPGVEDTVIQTIVKLTGDELIIRDQDQITYHLIRIRD
jgi:hypothetical protein